MAKLLLTSTVLLLFYTLTCSATVYTVGDSSGWDISTDLDSWGRDKTFLVGDTLLFQYSQYHSVDEVTKNSYDGCNTSNALQSSRNGNTTYVLSAPGDRYFLCGSRLHCLGGMKIHVHTVENQAAAAAPGGAPQAQPEGNLPPSSSRNSNPSSGSPGLSPVRMDSLVMALFGPLVLLFGVM